MGLTSSGTVTGLSRIYVDSRAGGANADGSADKPFDTFAEALAIVPDVSDEASFSAMLLRMRTIVISGNVGDIEVDVPVMIDNTSGIIGTLTCTAPALLVDGGYITTLDATDAEHLRVQNAEITTVTLEDCVAAFIGCSITTLTPSGTGELTLVNTVVMGEITIPAEYTARAMSSVLLGGVDGSIANYNSGVHMGT